MFQLLSIKQKIYLAFAILISSVVITTLISNHINSEFNQQVKEITRTLESFNLASQNIQSHSYQAQIALKQFNNKKSNTFFDEFSEHIDSIIKITSLMAETEIEHKSANKDRQSNKEILSYLNNIINISKKIKFDFESFSQRLPAYSGNGSIYDASFDSMYDQIIYDIEIESKKKSQSKDINSLLNAKFYIANSHVYLAEYLYIRNTNDSEDVLKNLDISEKLLSMSTYEIKNKFNIFKDLAINRISLHSNRQTVIDKNNTIMLKLFSTLKTQINSLIDNLIESDKNQIEQINKKSNKLELFSNVLIFFTLIFASILVYKIVNKLLIEFESIKRSILSIANEKDYLLEDINRDKYIDDELIDINKALITVNQHVQERIKTSDINIEVKNRIEIILNSAATGLLEISLNGRILSANTSACEMFFLTEKELLKSYLQNYITDINTSNQIDGQLDLSRFKQDKKSNKENLIKIHLSNKKEKEVQITITKVEKNNPLDNYAIVSILDLTDLRFAEERLAEQTTLFTSMIHDAPEAIVLAYKDRKIRSVNPAFCKLFGYSEEQVKGSTTEILYPSESEYLEAGKKRYNSEKKSTTQLFETDYMRKDGSIFSSETSGGSIKDPSGNIIGYMAFIRDISYRKEQQRKLKQYSEDIEHSHQLIAAISHAQQRFIGESNIKLVFDGLLQDILKITKSQYGFICDVDNENLDADGIPYFKIKSAAELNNPDGITEEKLHNKDFKKLLFTIIENKQTLIANNINSKYKSHNNLLLKNYMGQPYFYRDKLIGIVGISNRDSGYNLLLRDFLEPLFQTLGQFSEATRLEKIQKVQQQKVTQLALVASKTKNPVIITDSKGIIVWANNAFTKISEYTLEESIGHSPGELLQGKETDDDVRNYMHNQLANYQGFLIDVINYSKSGKKYWISIEVQPITDASGTTTGFIGVETDITEKRQANQELLNSVAQAETLAIQAQQASITKSEFLANMSHEIRTPMNGVIGMLNILISSGLNKEQNNFANLAYSSAESLLTLINDILDFSKIEAGKLEIEQIDFNFQQLIQDFSDSFSFRVKEKNIKFTCTINNKISPYLNGDPNRIRQILNNLCGNALKFTHSGTISLSISMMGDNIILFDISDTGIGIPKEKIDTLFEKFTQADGSTTRKYGGTGLGLSISKQLCHLMKGEINATSEVGKGSSFTFTAKLPVALTKPKSGNRINTIKNKSLSKIITDSDDSKDHGLKKDFRPTLLLAEDNVINQEVAKCVLADLGYQVVVANHGTQVLELLNQPNNFSAILMDCQMPIMDGYETTRNIRKGLAGKAAKNMAIIAMTANAMKGDREKCIKAGMDDYLSKPLNISNLGQKLHQWITVDD